MIGEALPDRRRRVLLALRAILVVVFVVHWVVLARFAVDVPQFDEWEYFRPDNKLFSLEWYFAQHNEHRIVVTKLLGWINYRLFDWNFAYSAIFDFAIYGAILVTLYRALLKLGFDELAFGPFFVFLLSDIAWENHAWSFQSQFHLFLLFHLWAVWMIARADDAMRRWILAAAFSVLAMWSFSSGIVVSVVLAGMTTLRAVRAPQAGRTSSLRPALYVGVVLVALALWFKGYESPVLHPKFAWPWTGAFWKHGFTQLALGFGWTGSGDAKWIASALILLVLVAMRPTRRLFDPRAWSQADFFLVTVFVSVLACTAVIALGRGAFGVIQARCSRYAEISGLLLPLCALLVARIPNPVTAKRALVALWLFAFVGHLDDWNFVGRYRSIEAQRKETLHCVLETRDESCPCSYDRPLRTMADRARELGIHFTRAGTR